MVYVRDRVALGLASVCGVCAWSRGTRSVLYTYSFCVVYLMWTCGVVTLWLFEHVHIVHEYTCSVPCAVTVQNGL